MRMRALRVRCGALLTGLLFALAIAAGSQAAAPANDTGWSPSMAKQLASPGWEQLQPPDQAPTVVYRLRFVQLAAQTAQALSGLLNVADPSQGALTIVTDAGALDQAAGDSNRVVLDAAAGQSTQSSRDYGAWLATAGHHPASMSVNVSHPAASTGAPDPLAYVQLILQPEQIDSKGKRVLCDITLRHLTPSGAAAQSQSKVWVGERANRPVALLRTDSVLNNRRATRYFALYVAARVIAPSDLPQDAAAITFGDMSGLQNLVNPLDSAPAPRPVVIGVHVGRGDAQTAWDIHVSGPLLGPEWMADVQVQAGDAQYVLGMDLPIAQGLRVSSQLRSTPLSAGPVIYLGMADRTHIGSTLELQAGYWPLHYTFAQKSTTGPALLQLGVAIDQPRWRIGYTRTSAGTRVSERGVLTVKITPVWALQGIWDQTPDGRNRYGFGARLSL